MIQNKINEKPRWITMTVPVLHQTIRTPKKICKLIYQLNLRGFKTTTILWGDPIIITLDSHREFIDKVAQAERSDKREVRTFYDFLRNEIDFKLNIHPHAGYKHEPVILSFVLKHSQINKFQSLFYDAFIRRQPGEEKMGKKYNNQHLENQPSDDEM